MIQANSVQYSQLMTGDEISNLIGDFSEVFGEQDQLKIVLKASPIESLTTYMLPRVILSRDYSSFDFFGDVQIMNPYDDSVPTVTIQYHFTAYLNFRVDESMKLFIEADYIDVDFISFEPYFNTQTKEETLQ